MDRLFELPPPQEGLVTFLVPQKSSVVPQNPNLLQHTLRGHFSFCDHCAPQPGSHGLFTRQPENYDSVAVSLRFSYLFWSQVEMQSLPQKSGPKPQTPDLLQHPILHGFEAELNHSNS